MGQYRADVRLDEFTKERANNFENITRMFEVIQKQSQGVRVSDEEGMRRLLSDVKRLLSMLAGIKKYQEGNPETNDILKGALANWGAYLYNEANILLLRISMMYLAEKYPVLKTEYSAGVLNFSADSIENMLSKLGTSLPLEVSVFLTQAKRINDANRNSYVQEQDSDVTKILQQKICDKALVILSDRNRIVSLTADDLQRKHGVSAVAANAAANDAVDGATELFKNPSMISAFVSAPTLRYSRVCLCDSIQASVPEKPESEDRPSYDTNMLRLASMRIVDFLFSRDGILGLINELRLNQIKESYSAEEMQHEYQDPSLTAPTPYKNVPILVKE
jgi:hypothetical protein